MRGKVDLTAYFALFWQLMLTSVLQFLEARPEAPVLFLSYEALLRDPRGQCERLGRFLDHEFGFTEGAGERLEAMAAGVDPGLWRNRDDRSFLALPEVSEEQKALFQLLLARTEDRQEPFEAAGFPLPSGAREYLENVSLLTAVREAE
jgi:hypothetical protein